MKRLIDPNDIHTAAATWSGFIYQGKVALYHVLHLLNTEANALNYSLQLDSLEDFAIVDADINPITLHQVKAMKSSLYSSYEEAFNKLEKRLREYPCNGAYFHISTQNEKTDAQIKAFHPTINIYKYGGNSFCQLKDINSLCEEQIALYLNNNQLAHHNNVENVSALRNGLESLICSQIIEIHANNHTSNGLTISEGAYYFIIPLENFKGKLVSDPITILNKDYFLFLTKNIINHYYLEFCHDIEDEGEVTVAEKTKLANYLTQINDLDDKSLVKFVQSILPHREVKLNSILDFKNNNIDSEEFRDAFLQTLHQLVESQGKIGDNLTWIGNDSLTYTATAINSSNARIKSVCRKIYDNINEVDIEVPYECDKLITSSIEVESIEKELNHQTQVAKNINNINNVTKWSNVSLTTLENAKKNIK